MKKLLLTLLAALLLFSGCAAQKQESQPQQTAAEQTAELEPSAAPQWEELRFDTSLPLSYATQFSVRYVKAATRTSPSAAIRNFCLSRKTLPSPKTSHLASPSCASRFLTSISSPPPPWTISTAWTRWTGLP